MKIVIHSLSSAIKLCLCRGKSFGQIAVRRPCYLQASIRLLHSLPASVDNPRSFVDNMACPGNRMRWDLSATDIAKQADELIESSKAVYDRVGLLKPDQVAYDNVIKVHIQALGWVTISDNASRPRTHD